MAGETSSSSSPRGARGSPMQSSKNVAVPGFKKSPEFDLKLPKGLETVVLIGVFIAAIYGLLLQQDNLKEKDREDIVTEAVSVSEYKFEKMHKEGLSKVYVKVDAVEKNAEEIAAQAVDFTKSQVEGVATAVSDQLKMEAEQRKKAEEKVKKLQSEMADTKAAMKSLVEEMAEQQKVLISRVETKVEEIHKEAYAAARTNEQRMGVNWASAGLGARVYDSSPAINREMWTAPLRALSSYVIPSQAGKLKMQTSAAPEMLLSTDPPAPGTAWSSFLPAQVAVQFAQPLKKVSQIAIRHLTREASPNPDAAPRRFRVTSGLPNGEEEDEEFKEIVVKEFEFSSELGLQVFDFETKSSTQYLNFEFIDNHGATKSEKPFVSLFRIEAYGEL